MAVKKEWKELLEQAMAIAHKETGIQLSEKNEAMVQSRLIKRMLSFGIQDPQEYLKYIHSHLEAEKKHIISLLTTHHTAFFREYFHFEDLETKYLKNIMAQKQAEGRSDTTIRVWSAACSRGQECYSLSMFFHKLKQQSKLGNFDYKIFGSDVDEASVQYARNGVYYYKELMQSPLHYVQGNWLRGLGDIRDFVKPKPHIKEPLSFDVGNLLNLSAMANVTKFDIIFCRNVLIYFNQDQVKSIVKALLDRLLPHGVLVLGISENIVGLGLPVKLLVNNIYVHEKYVPKQLAVAAAVVKTESTPAVVRVLCVDDSPTILAILQKILSKEQGFEVVATAKSAKEAREKLKTHTVDVMTLDIYMPDETGLEYLKKDYKAGHHPPVVMLSSIDRDGTDAAKSALELGASDYIEKPNLKNMDASSDEIRFKIRSLLKQNTASKKTSHEARSQPSSAQPLNRKIKVLIVDDSPTIHMQIKKMLSHSPNMEVIGALEDPRELEPFLAHTRPDVITLDINMPYMNGVDVVKKVISKHLIPTIVVSALGFHEGTSVMEALEAGAVDYFQKPSLSNMAEEGLVLVEKIEHARTAKIRIHTTFVQTAKLTAKGSVDKDSLIVIGSSTGGVEAITCILERLPAKIPPILIVQHIPPVFSQAFAERLNKMMPFEVCEAADNQLVQENCVYIAPGDKHMSVVKDGKGGLKIKLLSTEKRNNHRPSADVLFDSVVEAGLRKVTGVILTGMGNDGAKGLKKLREIGARTIAQNEQTCVVFGMPREAIKLGGAEFIDPLEHIASRIIELTS